MILSSPDRRSFRARETMNKGTRVGDSADSYIRWRVHCACWQTLLVQASFFHPAAPFFRGHDLCTLFVDQLSRDTLGIHGGHPGPPPRGLLHKLTHHAAACLIAIAAFESECRLTQRMRHAARRSQVRKSLVSSVSSGQ